MTQAQVDRRFLQVTREYGMEIGENIGLRVRRIKGEIHVVVYKGKRAIQFPLAMWHELVDAREVVNVAAQLLNGTVASEIDMSEHV